MTGGDKRGGGDRKTMVSLREEMRLLSAVDILEPLSEEEMEELARHNPDIRLREGEILFTPEEAGERLFILKQGRIRLYKAGSEGQEITLANGVRGEDVWGNGAHGPADKGGLRAGREAVSRPFSGPRGSGRPHSKKAQGWPTADRAVERVGALVGEPVG